MKIGIIGCGYVGQAAAVYWKQKGHQIAVTTRQPSRIAFLQTFADKVHLLEHNSLPSFIAQQEIVLISVAPDPSSNYSSTYLHTAKQVAKEIAQYTSLKQILYTSSTSVYEDHQGEWVDENTPISPLNENNQILHETERVLLDCASENLKVCVLRLGEIYGPDRKIEDRLRRMLHQPFPGSGLTYTNLIHLTDIVQALDFALQQRCQGTYNLCSDFHESRKNFYDILCQIEHLPPIQWNASLRNWHQGNKRVSNQKIKKEGFRFTHPSYFS